MPEMAVIIDWYGPYPSVTEAANVAKTEMDDYIYVGIGYKGKVRRPGRSAFLYAGKSNGGGRVGHLGDDDATYTSIWLGHVGSNQPSGPRRSKTRSALKLAEMSHIFALKPKLNVRMMSAWPSETVFLLNRWWDTVTGSVVVAKPLKGWPDIIRCGPDSDVGYKIFLDEKKPKVISFKRM